MIVDSVADVYLIFETCRLEHGLYRDSPWCSVLTPSMLEVIEYHQDVKYYWEDGYGHSISYEPACTLIDDILQHLELVLILRLHRLLPFVGGQCIKAYF